MAGCSDFRTKTLITPVPVINGVGWDMPPTLKSDSTAEAIEFSLEELRERLTNVDQAIAHLQRLAVLQGYLDRDVRQA